MLDLPTYPKIWRHIWMLPYCNLSGHSKALPNPFTIGILRISPKIPVVVDLAKKAQKQTISGRFWEIVLVKMNPRSPTVAKNMSTDILHA